MKNECGQMAVIALTMRAKQPKAGIVAGELGYIQVNNYPRADKASIHYTADGRVEELAFGETESALQYEVYDMQDYVENRTGDQILQYSVDVMHLLTEVRKQWGFIYPFE